MGAGASGSELAWLAGAGPELAGLARLARSWGIGRGWFGAGGAGASGSELAELAEREELCARHKAGQGR